MTGAARTEPPLDPPAELRAEEGIDPARIEAFVRRSLQDAADPVVDRLGAEP